MRVIRTLRGTVRGNLSQILQCKVEDERGDQSDGALTRMSLQSLLSASGSVSSQHKLIFYDRNFINCTMSGTEVQQHRQLSEENKVALSVGFPLPEDISCFTAHVPGMHEPHSEDLCTLKDLAPPHSVNFCKTSSGEEFVLGWFSDWLVSTY